MSVVLVRESSGGLHREAGLAATPAVPGAPPRASAELVSPFARLVRDLGREVGRGESLVRSAIAATRTGQSLGPAELIALQAGVYRYSEAVDLAARLVDRATSGLKTIVQGQ